MKKINVSKEELLNIDKCLERHDVPFREACDLGFPGFAGGLDHVEYRMWSITLVDRGMSSGSRVKDNTTKFCVPVRDRK